MFSGYSFGFKLKDGLSFCWGGILFPAASRSTSGCGSSSAITWLCSAIQLFDSSSVKNFSITKSFDCDSIVDHPTIPLCSPSKIFNLYHHFLGSLVKRLGLFLSPFFCSAPGLLSMITQCTPGWIKIVSLFFFCSGFAQGTGCRGNPLKFSGVLSSVREANLTAGNGTNALTLSSQGKDVPSAHNRKAFSIKKALKISTFISTSAVIFVFTCPASSSTSLDKISGFMKISGISNIESILGSMRLPVSLSTELSLLKERRLNCSPGGTNLSVYVRLSSYRTSYKAMRYTFFNAD